MKLPLSWLKDYVDIDLSLLELARLLTMLGLEVDEIQVIGLPMPTNSANDPARDFAREFLISGISWDPEKIVTARIDEVMPHPNADRLVLCRLNDGVQEYIVLTGAPNLFPYKGKGALEKPLKVAYAREGARIYDGHQPGQVLTTLKRAKIRGVDSFSMVCSEKELGISDEHEGVIILDDDAPVGVPLVEYIGDAVFDVSILPNMIRNASVLGAAREIAAATGKPLRKPPVRYTPAGESIDGKCLIEIQEPALNPRFTVGLIRGVEPRPSPYWVQRRLRLAGMRPINSVVDATNYVMLEIGQPLHAFDYDVLVQRAGGRTPIIITRQAAQGEKLATLDGVERTLDSFSILVCDTAGALSIAGVMGGAESEVTEQTRNVLLEGANWNFINIRRTVSAQRLNSEAAYRFARGIHPELAPLGVQLGLQAMQDWGGGEIAPGLVDSYPLPAVDPLVEVTPADVRRLLGIELSPEQIASLLERLEFTCRVEGESVYAQTPPHRCDIGQGVTGKADLIEEIARLYGYDNIPGTRMQDSLPIQRNNPVLMGETRVTDILVSQGLQELITYRMTTPEREARLLPPGAQAETPPYVRLANPITPERAVMRRSLLAAVLEIVERNSRLTDRLALFELGQVFLPVEGQALPQEPRRLAIALTGRRHPAAWDQKIPGNLDFYDLKGILENLFEELHTPAVEYEPFSSPTFHPGKCALVRSGETALGVFGELHPLVRQQYDFGAAPVLAADLDLDALLAVSPPWFDSAPVPAFPPVLEDIAVVVDESLPAGKVMQVIRQAGGKTLAAVRLFDIFRGEQIGAGKKSLAFSLTYQSFDKTLTDSDAAQIRQRILRRLDQEMGAKLRS
jgi:phenylalanyl-tRNA synthetase beta chain